MVSSKLINKIKPIVLIILLLPSFVWVGMFISGNMGVNPIDILMDKLGEMSLRLLVFVLIISSLSQYTFLRSLQNLRRLIGLVTFYYIFLHLTCYVFLDHFFNFSFIFKDIMKRPFITFGFLGFILLFPLVFTSTNKILKKLTFKVWKRIHYLIYIVVLLGVFHFYLLTKADKTEPLIYLGIVIFLFFLRIYKKFFTRRVALQ
jgi:sulfoxide reductase heme-binding subunit YedZ